MGDPSNPYYNDPYLAKLTSNLAGIFVDRNPGLTMAERARAGYYNTEAAAAANKAVGLSRLGALFRADTLDPREIGATGIESGVPVDQVSGYTRYNKSNMGAPDSEVARAFVGSGRALNKGEGVSLGDRENIRASDASNDLNRSTAVANIGAGATIQAANIHEAGADRRQFGQPVKVTPGEGVIFAPNDTRVPTGSAPNTVIVPVPARPTADKFVQSEDPNKPGSNVWRQATDGLPGPVAKAPVDPAATPKIVDDIELHSLESIPGAVYTDDNGKATAVNDSFRKMFGPKMAQAAQIASNVYRQTHDSGKAVAAYRNYLGIPPGTSFNEKGFRSFFNPHDQYYLESPDGNQVTPAPVAASPAPTAAPAAPPPADPIQQARDAIAKGADRGAVIQRLKQNGINPAGL